jgi:hypothetical protein
MDRRPIGAVRRSTVLVAMLSGTALSTQQPSINSSRPRDPQALVNVLKLSPGQTVSSVAYKGASYHAMEATALRVTTIFETTMTAISARSRDGALTTRLTDPIGNDLNRLPAIDLAATLDWANRQAYLSEGRRRRLLAPDIDHEIREVRTEWPNGVLTVAKAYPITNDSPGSFSTILT